MLSTSTTTRIMSKSSSRLHWSIGSPPPRELSSRNPFLSTLVPRAIAWFSVDDERVALLDGYTGASYTPPTVFFGGASLPTDMLEKLKETKVCTLSSVTLHDPPTSYRKAATISYDRDDDDEDRNAPKSFSFESIGLKKIKKSEEYPVAVESSPVQMLCTLDQCVDLDNGDDLIVLVVETFHVHSSVLSPPTELMRAGRDIIAKIDALIIQGIVSVGNGSFASLKELRSMPRPVQKKDGSWTSTNFDDSPESSFGREKNHYEPMEWSYRKHGGKCPLGYNALTALIQPRLIGWISTYKKGDRIPHLAPYSFFMDVSRGETPMVAFSGYRKNGEIPKDAQKDAEETGAFAYNMVTEELAVPMNYCAAPVEREESEFTLSGLSVGKGDVMDVPVVEKSPVRFECEYYKTVDVADFSVVIGKVRAVSVDPSVLSEGTVDVSKAKVITRLGFMDEYGILSVLPCK